MNLNFTVARSWLGLSANPTINFRTLAKNPLFSGFSVVLFVLFPAELKGLSHEIFRPVFWPVWMI
jgi:hypothetical protein